MVSQAPGVEVGEKSSGEVSVQGVSPSTYAVVGWFQRGPVNKPVRFGSYPEFARTFGGPWKNSDAPLSVIGFFQNGGGVGYAVRVVPPDATTAEAAIPGWKYVAVSPGSVGNLLRVILQGNATSYDTATATYGSFDVAIEEETKDGEVDFVGVDSWSDLNLADPDASNYWLDRINDESSGSDFIRVESVSGGVPSAFNPFPVASEGSFAGIGGVSGLISTTLVEVPVAKQTLSLVVDGTVIARDDGKGKIKAVAGAAYTSITGTVNYATGVVSIALTPGLPNGSTGSFTYIKAGVSSITVELTGGTDGTSVSRSERTDPTLQADKKGIYAFDDIDEILNWGLPDIQNSVAEKIDLITYVQSRGSDFVALDIPKGFDPQDAVNYRVNTLGSTSSYAALYYPNIKIADPLKNGIDRVISPVGHIIGRYAFTDTTRNVAKAPAGVIEGALQGITGVERKLTKTDRGLLNPQGINALVDSSETGRAIYGTRTLQKLGDYQVIPHRRTTNVLKKVFYANTQDLVFEPIGEALFTQARTRLESYLEGRAGDGWFASTIPSEAFRVVCDSSNNTPATIRERQLIIDVLVAYANPAEFITIRLERTLQPIG